MNWGNLITLEYGKPVKDKDRWDGAIPVFGTNGQIGTSDSEPLCKHASFILGRKGAYRGVHYSEVPFSVIDTAFYAEAISDEVDLHWAYYKFLTYDINSMDSGSAIPSTDRYEIYSLSIDLPSLDEQRKTVAILEGIDRKIRLNKQINDNLEQQAAVMFREMFISQADPSWVEGTISDLGTVVGGSTPSKAKSEYYTEHGIAWITPKDLSVDKSKFVSHGADDITALGLQNSSASIMPKGTVLFSSRAPIGYMAIADGDVTTNQGFKSVVPHAHVGTAFVYYFLKSALPIIEGMASGSTFKEISGSAMRMVPAIIPDETTLCKFSSFCEPLFRQQKTLEKQTRELASIRDTMLPKLMSGEIDVSNITP